MVNIEGTRKGHCSVYHQNKPNDARTKSVEKI